MSIFIIAEIGINHNGDLDILKELIDVAVDAGADAVKFQKRTIDLVYTKDFLDSPRESPWGKTQRDQKYALEFNINRGNIFLVCANIQKHRIFLLTKNPYDSCNCRHTCPINKNGPSNERA